MKAIIQNVKKIRDFDKQRAVTLATFFLVIALSSVGVEAQNCAALPAVPTGTTTTTQDRDKMMCQVGVIIPTLPSKLLDPNRPPSAYPTNAANPEGDWKNFYGHTITRSLWGLWNNYEDSNQGFLQPDGFNGWDRHTRNDPDSWRVFSDPSGTYAKGTYTPIDLLKMNNGTPVTTHQQWWNQRRPEILKDVQDQLYGSFSAELLPSVTFATVVTTGTANGVPYRQKVITGNIDTSSFPQLRNIPRISCTLRTPLNATGPVPVMIEIGNSINAAWGHTASRGWGACAYAPTSLQPDSGGAALSSYIIGLVNKGNWRKPGDWGTLAAWAWGVSKLIDYFETDADVDVKRLAIEGHSRYGKATIVTMAYEPRILIAYPSRGGSGGPKMNRRHWGQDLENSLGSTSEYHWYAGNAYKYVGPLNGTDSGSVSNATDLPATGPYPGNNLATWRTLNPTAGASTEPGTYLPRKLELLTVDAHSLIALAAPRPVFSNGGTHDSWTDFTGTYLAQVAATPVYNFLGRRGMIMPDAEVLRNTAYISGHLGYRYTGEPVTGGGHTDADDMPAFLEFAAKFFNDKTPPNLTLPADLTVEATGPNGAVVTYSTSAPDAVDDNVPVKLSVESGSTFAIGTTTVLASATDILGNVASGSFKVTVRDTTAPAFQSLTASPNVLTSRNHKMISVSISAVVSDLVDAAPVTRIVSVASNEDVNGPGDGNTSPDWEVTGNLTLNLRDERAGGGNGRVYTITVETRDTSGNTELKTVTVTVPHD